MGDPDDDPREEIFARARPRRALRALARALRSGDSAFAEASALYPPDMSEWQAAVYLLSGCEEVWGELGGRVMRERSIALVIEELERPRRPWGSSEDAVMQSAGDFWDVERWPAKFLYVFERFLFYRWVAACHLRQRIPPARTVTDARS